MSIYGLFAVFASAGIVIILLGLGLETGKIMAVIHLHRQWKLLNWLAKCFYIIVIFSLVSLTSAEVLGYLSQHHVQGFGNLESNKTALVALDNEETILRNRIKTIDATLSGLPKNFVSKRIRERENADYNSIQIRLIEIIREIANLKKSNIKDEAYTAPIFATAKIFNINETKAASMFILFLVLVLEPLSVGLAIATSSAWIKPSDKQKIIDPVAKAILRLIEKKGEFSGTVTELLAALNNINQEGVRNSRGKPLSALILGRRLRSKPLQQEFIRNGIYMGTNNSTVELCKVENK